MVHDGGVSLPTDAQDSLRLEDAQSFLNVLDNTRVTRFQWKIMLSGMGFFTDAYDLFVIGLVVALPKPERHLSTES